MANLSQFQIIWLSKNYGTHFMAEFMKNLKAQGFKDKSKKAQTFIENVVSSNYKEHQEEIFECFTKAKKTCRV